MITFPNAKINLGLNIVSKRPDGYHNLETIFYPVPIKDALEIILPDDQFDTDRFTIHGLTIEGNPGDNLVMKALRLVQANYYDVPKGLKTILLKKIPSGAGLGGGSSDAAFMLRLLNDSFNLGATKDELANLAVQLGADCPFFIYNQPVFASGIGEIFEEVDLSLKGYYMILIKPDIFVSTKDAFSNIKPKQAAISLKQVVSYPIEKWKEFMFNDFENTVFAKFPAIAEIKNTLYEHGALYASMSGSGSSVYGIFEKETDLKDCFSSNYYWSGYLD